MRQRNETKRMCPECGQRQLMKDFNPVVNGKQVCLDCKVADIKKGLG